MHKPHEDAKQQQLQQNHRHAQHLQHPGQQQQQEKHISKLERCALRHGLTPRALVVLLLTLGLCGLLLATLLAMTVLWSSGERDAEARVCLTPDCLRAAAQGRTGVGSGGL